MRVVYVCTDQGVPAFGRKGASVHVQAILTQLLDRGDDVHLVNPRPGSRPAGLSRVHVHEIAVGARRDGERERAAQDLDRRVASILDDIHSQAPVDLVYERYALWGRTTTSWARAHGVASVLEVNSPLPDEQARHRVLVDRAAADAVARDATARADAVVCVSSPVAHWVRALGTAAPDSIHVIPNGVDTRRFASLDVRRDPATFTLGFVGTLKPWHGVADLVRALALLHRHDTSYRLLVVGDGPERGSLETLVDHLGLRGAAEFSGSADPVDVPALLARMDVAVAPYPPSEDFYFSPLKINEYFAAGLPVITSDVGNLPALLTGGAHPLGLLYPAGSADGLARVVSQLRDDPVARADLGGRGRRAAVEHHDWKRVVDRILDLVGVAGVTTQAS